MPEKRWTITSLTSEIFEPEDNPATRFINAVDHTMNSDTVLIKGRTDKQITQTDTKWLEGNLGFIYDFLEYNFLDLFLEFDRLRGYYDYYEWEETPASIRDFYAGYKPYLKQIIKSDFTIKAKPMSYLGFLERLYWMLRQSPMFHHDRPPTDHETTNKMIFNLSTMLLGDNTWKPETPPDTWFGVPNWVDNPWKFYDLVPNFLKTNGYYEDEMREDGYFSDGQSDSCLFFFKDTTFYFLLTNGNP